MTDISAIQVSSSNNNFFRGLYTFVSVNYSWGAIWGKSQLNDKFEPAPEQIAKGSCESVAL